MSPRVLVIDDSPMLLELTTRSLQGAGYHAAGAMDLASLDAKLSEGVYDLILVDINMPEMFGDDVVEFLRTQRGVTSKLVLYSDIAESELQAKTRSCGATGYILKGLGLEHALAEIQKWVGPAKPPAPSAEAPKPLEAPKVAAAAPARKKRVLILDDSEMTAQIIEADLTAKGFEVYTADTADKATKIILKKQTRPDLVLLDVRMPNVNGEQFCRFIKSNSLFKGIKVLLCSGENVEELQRICREAGADGYVTKDAVMSKVVDRELI